MGLAVVVVLAFWAVVAVIAVGAGHPGASAAVGVGVNGQVVHRFSLIWLMDAVRLGWRRRRCCAAGTRGLHAEIAVVR